MSSPLDGRIRALARAEAASMFTGVATTATADLNTDRVAELQQQITDLHEHLHHAATIISRLEARLDVLEKAATGTPPQAALTDREQTPSTPARRTRRKTGDE